MLTAITTKDPEYLPAWRRLAEIALAEGRYDDSIAALQPVLKKHPSDLEALLVRGRIHLAKQETAEAIATFQRVVQVEPRLAAGHYNLALAQLQAGNAQQAKAELTAALAASPQFVDARLMLATLNIQSGSVQAAIEDLDNLTRSMPRLREAYRLLGTAYMRRGDARKATETYRKFAELAPNDPQGAYLVGIGLRAEGKPADARKQFESALEKAPGFVDPLAQLVTMKLADKDAAGAAALVKKQLAAVNNNSGPLHQVLGEVYFAQGKREEAEQAFLKAIELEPRLSASYTSLATIYAAQNKLDAAITKLDEAHRLAPKNLAPLMMLGHRQGAGRVHPGARDQSALRAGGQQPRLADFRERRRQGEGAAARADREGGGARRSPHLRHARLDPLQARRLSACARTARRQRRQAARGADDPVPPGHDLREDRKQGRRAQGPGRGHQHEA